MKKTPLAKSFVVLEAADHAGAMSVALAVVMGEETMTTSADVQCCGLERACGDLAFRASRCGNVVLAVVAMATAVWECVVVVGCRACVGAICRVVVLRGRVWVLEQAADDT